MAPRRSGALRPSGPHRAPKADVAAHAYSGMPAMTLNGNVIASAAVSARAGFACGKAMRIAVGAAM